jgi:hypothetical protein
MTNLLVVRVAKQALALSAVVKTLSCKLHKLGMHGEQASKAAPTTGEAGC